ncbi:ATP-dependent helicase [Candidatus Micrarchaeota archaeon]|nr:ATP-dependent helicase [Candidatus Micrarchaeota archaeon]
MISGFRFSREELSFELLTEAHHASTRKELLQLLHPTVAQWFSQFKEITLPQQYGVTLIHDRQNALISAPTGSGKTFTAFLSILNELVQLAEKKKLEDRVYCVYVSPLRALAADIEKNLSAPLKEMEAAFQQATGKTHGVRVAMRSGDTPPAERARMAKKPPHILITTPESLAIILASPKFIENFQAVQWMVVDEIHELCNSKRGVHLSLSIERLQRLNKKTFSRIGLSATIAPLEDVAEFLVGYQDGRSRDCTIVNAQFSKKMDIELLSPSPDLVYVTQDQLQKRSYKILDELIRSHRTTLIFTNTRAGTERIVHHLKNYFPGTYGEGLEAHHSSLSRSERQKVENRLKNGELKAVVCSTSLELGIDIGYIDLVVQVGSPKSVARALQRTGRSGHDIYKVSESKLIALDRDDVVEMGVMLSEAKKGHIDRVQIPQNALDVLAQHVVGLAIEKPWDVEEAFQLVKQSYCYRNLSRDDFLNVLRFLSGGFGQLEKYRVYGKIWFDEEKNAFGKRGKLVRIIYCTNIGTIPDEVSVRVNLHPAGMHIGNIEEDFLERLKKGDRFVLGGKTYQFEYARGMQCYVSKAGGMRPTIPQWFSEMLPLSFDLASAIGRFRGNLALAMQNKGQPEVLAYIRKECSCNENAALAIYHYFAEQMGFFKLLGFHGFHSDERLIVEEFQSEGRRHFIFHALFGRRVNEVLSKILAKRISHEINRNVLISFNDNGFVLTCTRAVHVDIKKQLFMFARLHLDEEAMEAIQRTETLRRKFRHVAVRSFMILRNYMGRKRSVGKMQMSAHVLFGISSRLANFPVVKETFREILEDHMDLRNARVIQERLRKNELQLSILKPYDLPSPFAQLLITQGISDVVLLADRRAILERLHSLVLKRLGKSVPEAPVNLEPERKKEAPEPFNPLKPSRRLPRKRPRWTG